MRAGLAVLGPDAVITRGLKGLVYEDGHTEREVVENKMGEGERSGGKEKRARGKGGVSK